MAFETITVVRDTPGGHDQYGDPIAGTEARTDVPGCLIAPRGESGATAEPGDRNRMGVIVGLTVYAPLTADIRHTDRIEARDALYEVVGEPGEWRSPYGGVGGIQVALKRAEG